MDETNQMLRFMEKMLSYHLEGQNAPVLPTCSVSPLRPDEARPGFFYDELKLLSGYSENGFFVIQNVLDGQGQS